MVAMPLTTVELAFGDDASKSQQGLLDEESRLSGVAPQQARCNPEDGAGTSQEKLSGDQTQDHTKLQRTGSFRNEVETKLQVELEVVTKIQRSGSFGNEVGIKLQRAGSFRDEMEMSFAHRLQEFTLRTEKATLPPPAYSSFHDLIGLCQLDAEIRSKIKILGSLTLVAGAGFVGLKGVSEVCYRVGLVLWLLSICVFTTMDTCMNSFAAQHCLFYHANAFMMFAFSAFYWYTAMPGMLITAPFILYVLVCQRWIRTQNEETPESHWPSFTTTIAIWIALYTGVGFGGSELYLYLNGNIQFKTDTGKFLYITTSAIYIIGATVAMAVYILTQRIYAYDSTRAFYAQAYTSFFFSGIGQAIWGVVAQDVTQYKHWLTGENNIPTHSIGEAMISAIPYVLVTILFGRYRRDLYLWFPRLVQRKRSIAAGAFMAAVVGNESASKLQELGLSRLRAAPLSAITLELLTKHREEEPALVTPEQREALSALYNCSSPCEPGTIDFFITHSWSDDPHLKHEALQRVGDKFRQENEGREPVVWFDKLCIDQTQIDRDIQCLPIFLMSCQKLLVLCGASYLTRLWCLFELSIFFSMIENAAEQTEFLLLDATMEQLMDFRVENANCYLAKDKANLIGIISSQGEGRFEADIRDAMGLISGSTVIPLISIVSPLATHVNTPLQEQL